MRKRPDRPPPNDLPKGEISDGTHAISLAANDQLYKAADYQNVVVATSKSGASVKLHDMATITDSTINEDRAGWFDGKRPSCSTS